MGPADRPHADRGPSACSDGAQRVARLDAALRRRGRSAHGQRVVVAAQRESAVDDAELTRPRCDQGDRLARPRRDAGGDDVGGVLAQQRCPGQVGLAEAGDDERRTRVDRRRGQAIPKALSKNAFRGGVEDVRGGRQGQRVDRRGIERRDQHPGERGGRLGEAEFSADDGRHHVDGNRGRRFEHPRLVAGLLGEVGVVRVEGDLLGPADDEHRGAQHQQRPQHVDLGRTQWPDRVKGPDAGQDRRRGGPGVPQHRGQCDGQLGDGPRVREVAEVDDAVRVLTHSGDDVGVGQIEMYCLTGQFVDQGCHPCPRLGRSGGQALAQRRVADVGSQRLDDVVAEPQVPLQRTVQAGVPEVGERAADAGR